MLGCRGAREDSVIRWSELSYRIQGRVSMDWVDLREWGGEGTFDVEE